MLFQVIIFSIFHKKLDDSFNNKRTLGFTRVLTGHENNTLIFFDVRVFFRQKAAGMIFKFIHFFVLNDVAYDGQAWQGLTNFDSLHFHVNVNFSVQNFFEKPFQIESCVGVTVGEQNSVWTIRAFIFERQAVVFLKIRLFSCNFTRIVLYIGAPLNPHGFIWSFRFVLGTVQYSHSIFVQGVRLCLNKKRRTKLRILNL